MEQILGIRTSTERMKSICFSTQESALVSKSMAISDETPGSATKGGFAYLS